MSQEDRVTLMNYLRGERKKVPTHVITEIQETYKQKFNKVAPKRITISQVLNGVRSSSLIDECSMAVAILKKRQSIEFKQSLYA